LNAAALLGGAVEAEVAAAGRFEREATPKTYPRLQIIPFAGPASVERAKREETRRQERLI
jgi:hypothetical protein